MPARPFSPAHALRHLLPRYVAEWVRLSARRPVPADAEDAGVSVDESADATRPARLPKTSGDAAEPSADVASSSTDSSASASEASARSRDAVSADATRAKDSVARPAHRLLFVDAFARSGLHALERGPGGVVRAVDGERSVAAVRELLAACAREGDAHHRVDCIAVLADEDPAHLAALDVELARSGLADRVRRTDDPATARPGDILLVEADFAAVADALCEMADEATASLFFLAPPAARRLPWPAYAPLVEMDSADVLLALPHADLHRLAPFADTSLADLPPQPRRVVEGFSALLGDPRHGWLSEWRRADREAGPAAAEARLSATLRDALRDEAPEAIVRAFRFSGDAAPAKPKTKTPVRPPAEPRPVLYLFHTSDEPSHALGMNGVLREMRLEDATEQTPARRAARQQPTEAETSVLDLFAADLARRKPADDAELPVDVAALTESIAADFRGRTVAYRAVLCALARTDVTADEARRAMALLKRSGRAVYRSLAEDTAEVSFPTTPIPPAARKRRTPTDDAGPLFAPPEGDGS